MSGRETGRKGEALAVEVLEENGYIVVGRNVHSLYGELDIVAIGEGCVCFVEVKLRSKNSIVSPEQSITPAKKRRIISTALIYMQSHPKTDNLQPRFDLFSIITDGNKVVSYEHMKNAFEAEGY